MVAPKKLAVLLSVSGKSVRAMQTSADILRESGLMAQAVMLESAAVALAKALHDASQDTVPILIDDVTGD